MIAQVPQELLDASMEQQAADEEERHFRSVFQEFLSTKEKCGENTKGLTFEKFRRTLEKNRDQILSRHKASRVRFTVYVKDGRAALKATPVKS